MTKEESDKAGERANQIWREKEKELQEGKRREEEIIKKREEIKRKEEEKKKEDEKKKEEEKRRKEEEKAREEEEDQEEGDFLTLEEVQRKAETGELERTDLEVGCGEREGERDFL